MCVISSDRVANVTKDETKKSATRGKTSFDKDRRRKHHHFLVSVYYADGEIRRAPASLAGGEVRTDYSGFLIISGCKAFCFKPAKAGKACRGRALVL